MSEDTEDDKLCYVEWEKDKPFSVVTENENGYCTEYDVDHNNAGEGVYHDSGGYPISNLKKQNLLNKGLEKLPKDINTMRDLIRHYNLEEGYVVWCEICKDFVDEENLCEHLMLDEWGEHVIKECYKNKGDKHG